MGISTGFFRPEGASTVDIGANLVEKSYLIDRYPELADTFKQAGLWLWGENSNHQLGNNTSTSKSSPIQTVSGGTNWKLVSVGAYHNAGIKTDGIKQNTKQTTNEKQHAQNIHNKTLNETNQ